MSYKVKFSRKTEDQLFDLECYIAERSSPSTAETFVAEIVTHCLTLSSFPERFPTFPGRPHLRRTHFEKRTIIVYAINDERQEVEVVGIFYGGQDVV